MLKVKADMSQDQIHQVLAKMNIWRQFNNKNKNKNNFFLAKYGMLVTKRKSISQKIIRLASTRSIKEG